MTRAPYRSDAQTELFAEVIDKISLGEPEFARYMQVRFGSALCGENPEQIAVLMYGEEGQGGKSTLLNAFEYALGDYAKSANPDTFLRGHHVGGNRDDLTTLAGARLITTSEPDEEGVIDVGTFKRLTGGDTITASGKWEKTRSIRPTWKIFMAANNFPALRQSGNPIWRRFEVMPFDYIVSDDERIADIETRLAAEATGILAWLVAGCVAWFRAGCKLELPRRAERAIAAYKREADTVRAWFIECAKIEQDARVGAALAYESYKAYCRLEGRKPVSHRGFGQRMTALSRERTKRGKTSFERLKTGGRITYIGARLKGSG